MGRFRRLCQEHRDRIYTFAFYYMGNREDAEFDLQVSGGLGLHRDYFRLYIARPVSNQTRDLDLSLRFSRAF